MNKLLRQISLRPLRPSQPTIRSFSTTTSRFQQQPPQQPQYQPPSSTSNPDLPPDPYPSSEQPQRKPNPHGAIYKSGGAGRAIAYNFLIAMVTFQVLYWGWMKLESLEVKKEKEVEIRGLEGELRGLVNEGSGGEEGKGIKEGEKGGRGGWWGWGR